MLYVGITQYQTYRFIDVVRLATHCLSHTKHLVWYNLKSLSCRVAVRLCVGLLLVDILKQLELF
jgi:hypothetical protein